MPDEPSLAAWQARLAGVDAVVSVWREPDMDGEVTSMAVGPSPAVERAVSCLPLLLRELAVT